LGNLGLEYGFHLWREGFSWRHIGDVNTFICSELSSLALFSVIASGLKLSPLSLSTLFSKGFFFAAIFSMAGFFLENPSKVLLFFFPSLSISNSSPITPMGDDAKGLFSSIGKNCFGNFFFTKGLISISDAVVFAVLSSPLLNFLFLVSKSILGTFLWVISSEFSSGGGCPESSGERGVTWTFFFFSSECLLYLLVLQFFL